eukprot:TRINITY_DN23439_c0_g7_i1.p1 TRINITY_DN23439_c0_g7~~TRINITY_DN23439_c0_g7_i1.p1  ORF type:complete len:326 (+),score=21.81 TRINITY_DN23439_c0_g7_i1:100-1077(+)
MACISPTWKTTSCVTQERHCGSESAPRIVACGSLCCLAETDEAIRLSGKERPVVLYVGVASYDRMIHREVQAFFFRIRRCSVTSLQITRDAPSIPEMKSYINGADIVLLSYGNTLFAADRIRLVGLDVLIREAADEGKVIMGGSAGAIISFDGGHSDSMNPWSYKAISLRRLVFGVGAWDFIRSPGLGLCPGFVCPHHDARRSDGLYRADDFMTKLKTHCGESALAIDEAATLVIDGLTYRVLATSSAKGSVGSKGEFVYDKRGRAGLWKYTVSASGIVSRAVMPENGLVSDLTALALFITEDALLSAAREDNPDDGTPPVIRFC